MKMAGHKPQPTPEQIAKLLEANLMKWEAASLERQARHAAWLKMGAQSYTTTELEQQLTILTKDKESLSKLKGVLPKQIDPITNKPYAVDCLQMRRLQALLDKINSLISDFQAASGQASAPAAAAASAHVMPGAPGRVASKTPTLEAGVSALHL
jgi:hypothetical protein